MKSPDEGTEGRLNRRSQGLQSRSRERIEQILSAAEVMVAETGMEGLKMRELARRAGLPIASLYHYFPSSSSVIRALALRHMEGLSTLLSAEIPDMVQSQQDDVHRAATGGVLVRKVAGHLLQTPASASIWDSLRSTPELRQLDIEDTMRNARDLEPYLSWVAPGLPAERVSSLTRVLLEAVQANLIVIMHSPADAQGVLLDATADMVVATLRGYQQMRHG